MSKYYLAIDIGASSGRHILGSVENGKIKLEEVYRFPNGAINKNGKKCWDFDSLFDHVVKGIAKCAEIGKKPELLGIDTWGVDFALLDKNGEIIGDTVCYRDSRTEGMDEEVYKFICANDLYARTGIQKQIFNTVYQLMAVKKETPEAFDEAADFLMMPDLLNYKLTGVKEQEYTNATTGQLVNIETGEWDLELIEKLGYPTKMFKKLSQPGTVVGKLSAEIEAKVGYNLTVVHAPSHDTASAFLASPAVSDNAIYLSSGTWSLMGIESKVAHASKAAADFNITNEGGYNHTYRVLKNIMGLWIIQSIKKELGKYSFAELCDMARAVGDTKYRIDVNDQVFLAPDSMIAAIKNYCNAPDMPIDELLCCVYHSLAISYSKLIGEMSDMTGVTYDSINIFGGGCQDNYLNELTAKYCNMTVLAGPIEATSIGNIVSLLIADGVFATVEEARESIRNSFEIKIIKN